MVQRHSKYMKGTDFLDQKTTVYAFDGKVPGKYYCRPWFMGLYWYGTDKLVHSIWKGRFKISRCKQRKYRKTQNANWWLLKEKTYFNTRRHRSQPWHRIEFLEKHGRCQRYFREEKTGSRLHKMHRLGCLCMLKTNSTRNNECNIFFLFYSAKGHFHGLFHFLWEILKRFSFSLVLWYSFLWSSFFTSMLT